MRWGFPARRWIDALRHSSVLTIVSTAWTETGKIDERGRQLGVAWAHQLDAEADSVDLRIRGFPAAGWRKVRIVTHGWLLAPGGLPKFAMSAFLVESKWARCALVRGESTTDFPTYPWYWNENVRIASPPGIGSFWANVEYAHGGVGALECIVPELEVELGQEAIQAKITASNGAECVAGSLSRAIRQSASISGSTGSNSTSIVSAAREASGNSERSLAVPDDEREGAGATLVSLDNSGNVLD
jgi:hypothetical protein